MPDRYLFRVTCKAAIYDEAREFVLLAIYTPTSKGIPGGHLEEGENPDDAMRRELQEEIGFVPDDLERKDFFLHSDGKLVLGYTGTCDNDQKFDIDPIELRELVWVKVDDIRNGKQPVDSYGDFITKWAR